MSHPLLTAPLGATLFRLAGPTTALMLAQVAVAIADVYFAARLGVDALAGIALVVPFSALMTNIANGAMGGGVAASMARALGAGRIDDARAVVLHALALAVSFGVLFAALDWTVARPLFAWLGGDNAALAQALGFSHVWFTGAVAIWTSAFLAAILRGAGDAATPGLYGLWASALYIPTTAVLTLGAGDWPGLGLAGSAIASVLIAGLTTLALVRVLWSARLGFVPSFRDARLRPDILREILRVGVMGSITTVTASATAILATGLVSRFGVAALAGYGIGARLEFMVAPVAFGIGSGLTTIVGVAAGADCWRRAMTATWFGGASAFFIVGAIGWTVASLPAAWSGLFTSDDAVTSASVSYIRHVAPFYCFFGLGLALYFASQGAGRMAVPVAAGFVRLFVTAVGGWLMAHQTHFGLAGVFVAIAGGLVIYGCLISGALLIAPWRGRKRLRQV